MTREEAIEFVAQSVKSDVDMAKIADAIRALEQEPKWIPVSERLPETDDGRFLAYIENPYDRQLSYIMTCDYMNQSWYQDDEIASSNVVAWMPLPEPYKAESEE